MNAGNISFEAVRPFARVMAREVSPVEADKRAKAERIGTTTGVREHVFDDKPDDIMPW